MTELKPCPFCGGKAKLRYSMPFSWVECTKCNASIDYKDRYEMRDGEQKAVDMWNMRVNNG